MYRRAAAATVTLAALLVWAVVPVAASSPTWANTDTQAVTLTGATDLGQLTSSIPIQISVAVALRNQPALQNYISAVSTPGSAMYGQSLTPSEFKAAYSPTDTQVQTLESYLTGKGFENVSASHNNIYVTGWATPAQADSAFNTKLESYQLNGSTVFANVAPAQVPSSLAGTVVSVLGLTNAFKMSFGLHQGSTSGGTPSTNVPNSYWAPGFQQAYGATGTSPASNTSIAIMAEGDVSQVVTDLRDYEQDSNNGGLPEVPVTVEPVGIASSDTSGLVEWDMDTQTSTGIAGDVQHLYIYDATTLTDGDVALEFNTFVTQDLAKAGSASFGECEYNAYLDGFMMSNDEVMSEMAAQGQTLFASAGDSGGFCAVNGLANGVPAGEPDVNYPASSPYVVAAGGTSLVTNTDGSYGEELAWDAGGGGISYFEYQPSWQSGVTPPDSEVCQFQAPACLGKALPDVAMDADFLLSAANFYSDGTPTSNGGTSLASPLSLGSWARIESNLNNGVGFAAPTLYAAAGTDGFNDVTLGDNGPYPALPGWDYATGNGSFNIANMINVIGSSGPSSGSNPTFAPVPAPACNEAFGDGSASPLISDGQDDALAIQAVGVSSDRTNQTITGVIQVKSLNDGPGGTPEISGAGDQWYLEFSWQPAGASSATTYFLSAAYDASTIAQSTNPDGFAFGYGHLTTSATGGGDFNPDGTATGTVDMANGLIYITVPWSDFGSQLSPAVATPVVNSPLKHVGAASYEEIGQNTPGGLLEAADSAAGTQQYLVGHNCNPATVTLDSASLNQAYSGGPDAATATTSPAGLDYSVTYNGSATAPTQPGTYAVAASINDLDYVGSTSGTLTIAPAPLTVSGPSVSSTYGGALPSLTPQYSGFVNGDSPASLTSPATCSTTASSSSAVGTYAITCSGASSSDYNITYKAGTLTINRAPLSVTASSGAISFGQAIPAISPTYSGFVNGDSSSSLTSAPSCATTATAASPAGTYATTCTGGSGSNYTLSYKAGNVTINLAKTSLAYTGPTSVQHDSKAKLSAKLASTVTQKAVSGRSVTLAIGSQKCVATTNASGVASCAISKVSAKKGASKVSMSFAGDAKGAKYDYAASSGTKSIKVK